jgi:nitrogen fixation-related uncharacterized protein
MIVCPNCILNQAGMTGGLYVAFGICLLFFLVGIVAIFWAFRNGEFENTEDIKFDMLDDSEDGAVAKKAREAIEQTRRRAV